MKKFAGTGVALVTPFTATGEIDYNALERVINHTIDGGVDYLASLGTTGETATLTKDERLAVWNYTLEKADGRVPVVAGLGGNNTAELLKAVKELPAGFAAVLSVSPYYNKPSQQGIYNHYRALSEHCDNDIILYNVPARTGSNLIAETCCRLAELQNIVAVKEAGGDMDQVTEILLNMPEGFNVISGDDGLTVPMIAVGGIGVISVTANAIPKQVSDMVNAALANDYKKAAALNLDTYLFTKAVFKEGNPAGVKAALAELGLCTPEVRMPLAAATAALSTEIKALLGKIRL